MARILVVTVAHPPADARILHRQIAALSEFGHEVTYAAPFSAFGGARPEDLRTVDLPRSAGGALARVPALMAAARLLLAEWRRQDLVLAHDPELLPVLLGARLRALVPAGTRGPVLVWDVHEDVPAQVSMLRIPFVLKRVVAPLFHAVELVAERSLRLLLAESGYQARFSRQHPVVRNSVRLSSGGPLPAEAPPRVVYLGSLTWPRGAAEIIELARRVPEVKFEVIGNAKPDVEIALAEASRLLPNLDYRGFVPNDEAVARLPGALAGLSLLHDEPNYAHSEPTKIMEYMAAAVPSITTPNPASRALVEAADAGIVVGFGDVEAMEAAVRCLTVHLPDRERLARNAYAAAREHDWGTEGPAFAALLARWAARAGDG